MGLDISLLETFVLVSDLGSFSGAARRQGLTQPAISFQVKALEKELGAPLIDRSHGRVVLTPAGRTAYWHAKRILSDRDALMGDIPRLTGEVSGRLLIAASNIPGEYLLPPLVGEFASSYPDVRLSLEVSDSGRVVEMVKGEDAELGFIGMRVRDPDVSSRKFSSDRLVLVVPAGHPLARQRKVTVESLKGQRFINRKRSSGTRARLESLFAERGLGPGDIEGVAEMGSTQAILQAVASGAGVSVVSDRAAGQGAVNGTFAVKELADADLTRDFFAISLKRRPLSVAGERFFKFAVS